MNFNYDSLVVKLVDKDFNYLSREFSGECLELAKEKGVYSYEYVDSLMRVNCLIKMHFLVH